MAGNPSEQLLTAMKDRALVRLSRKFEGGVIRGYVLGIGPEFFVLALVSDRIWLDGYECFRIADIRKVEPDPYAAFAEAALTIRDEPRPQTCPVSVDSLEDLLRSAAAYPLVALHKERIDPDVCSIGRVLFVSDGQVFVQEIRPDATWEADPETHRLGDITRISFGGDYEDALYRVGGDPPADRFH